MKKATKYFIAITSFSIFLIFLLISLFKKYAWLTLSHLIPVCKQTTSKFFFSGTHYIGLLLVAGTSLVIIITLLKLVSSYLKTQKSLHALLKLQTQAIPSKLNKILNAYHIPQKHIVVVKSHADKAMTVGFLSPKIIISLSLINKLPHKQLESVVLHELYHRNNWHTLILVIGEAIASSLFFVPLLKELVKAMRTAFEKEADLFASRQQTTTLHLQLALINTSSTSFPMRKNHHIKKNSFKLSLLTVCTIISLSFLPTATHAHQTQKQFHPPSSCQLY